MSCHKRVPQVKHVDLIYSVLEQHRICKRCKLEHIDLVNLMERSGLRSGLTFHLFGLLVSSSPLRTFDLQGEIRNIAIETLEQHGTI